MDFLDKAFIPARRSETIRKSRGGIRDISELTAPSVYQVHGLLASGKLKSAVTITYKSIMFTTSCVKYFDRNCQYLSIRVDEESLRLIIEPTTEHDKNGLKGHCGIKVGKILFQPTKYRVKLVFPWHFQMAIGSVVSRSIGNPAFLRVVGLLSIRAGSNSPTFMPQCPFFVHYPSILASQ